MGLSPDLELWALASITNTGVVSFAANSGRFLSVARAAAGDVTVTLQPDQGADLAERAVVIQANDPAARFATLDITAPSDTALRVRTWSDAGAATDASFSIVVFKKRP